MASDADDPTDFNGISTYHGRGPGSQSSFHSDIHHHHQAIPSRTMTPDNTMQNNVRVSIGSPGSVIMRPSPSCTTRNFSRPLTIYKSDESTDRRHPGTDHHHHHHHHNYSGSISSISSRRRNSQFNPLISPNTDRFPDISDSEDGASLAFYTPRAVLSTPPDLALGGDNTVPPLDIANDNCYASATTSSKISAKEVRTQPSIRYVGNGGGAIPEELMYQFRQGGFNSSSIASSPSTSPSNSKNIHFNSTNSTHSTWSDAANGMQQQPLSHSLQQDPPTPTNGIDGPFPHLQHISSSETNGMAMKKKINGRSLSSSSSIHAGHNIKTMNNNNNNNTGNSLESHVSHGSDPQKNFGSKTSNSHNNGQTQSNNDNISSLSENHSIGSNHAKKLSSSSNMMSNNSSKKPAKICKKCNKEISGQFVRALDAAYHSNCFVCEDCGKKCSAKFFPLDTGNGDIVPLCEYDYFRRLDLLCSACDGPLRGSYITAVGKKYHIEHFKCSVCSCLLGPEDTYYEHENEVLCHYHYSAMHAAKCEGCGTSILKQFVEIYRGGKELQWHPECYMIFKFWNVKLHSPETRASAKASPSSTELDREDLFRLESQMEKKVFNIWTVLCGYEEATAACISDMLQYASSGAYDLALKAICSLVFNVEVLFKALDRLLSTMGPYMKLSDSGKSTNKQKDAIVYQKNDATISDTSVPSSTEEEEDDDEDLLVPLGREPKTLCRKLVSFMSFISKNREKGNKQAGVTPELLSLVTSLAHYLKVLLRYGLSSGLQMDNKFPDSQGSKVELFLQNIKDYQNIPPSAQILGALNINAMVNDHCAACKKSVEDAAIHYKKRQWHVRCFVCSSCNKSLGPHISDARWIPSTKKVVCSDCAPSNSVGGFVYETRLRQYIILLKIAVARLELVLKSHDAKDAKYSSTVERDLVSNETSVNKSLNRSGSIKEKGYMTTLQDIRKLRASKLDKRLSSQNKEVRRSTILDLPSFEEGQVRNVSSPGMEGRSDGEYFQSSIGVIDEQTADKSDINDKKTSPILSKDGKTIIPDENKKNRLQIFKRKKKNDHQLTIEEIPISDPVERRTTDLFNNEKSLTLDDIPRIVAAEKARDQLPNSFKHRAKEALSTEIPNRHSVSPNGEAPNIRYVSDLTPKELLFIQHIVIQRLYPMISKWISMDDLTEIIEVKKSPSLWGKVGKAFGSKNTKQHPKPGVGAGNVFGQPLESLVEKYGVDSTLGAGPSTLRIPAFIDDCISSMKQKDMSVEGIFRKNGNIRRLKEYSEKVDKNPNKGEILAEENAIQLAALLKKFLREMPEPLLTVKLQNLWITAQSLEDIEEKKRTLHLISILLPKIHRDVSEVLFHFLNWVASFSQIDEESGSKMDAHNLATVITPNIMNINQADGIKSNSKPGTGPSDTGDAYFLSIESVSMLIEQQQELAFVPQDVWAIYERANFPDNMTTKEIFARCEQVMKELQKDKTMVTSERSSIDQNGLKMSIEYQSNVHQETRPIYGRANSSYNEMK